MKEKDLGIWITGASSGIGKETAKEFARVGGKVIVSSRRHNLLELINRELKEDNLSVQVIPCNIASSTNVEQVVKQILRDGNMDCLINNAGITSFQSAEEDSVKEIKEIINVNLLGSIFCIKAVLPHMIERRKGTIINVLSTAATQVFTNSSAYAASKSGLLAYTNVLREEVRKYNIKVINVIPGATKTNMWPNEILDEHSEKMMKASEVAHLLVSLYLQDKSVITEEIRIKPIYGDI